MAYQDPNDAFVQLRDRTVEGLKLHFPMKGKVQTLFLDEIEVNDTLKHDDFKAQHEAKNEGRSFTVPITGKLRLVDNATGKVVDQRKLRLVDLPKQTSRYSYIMNGQEFQLDNQWQLKSGAYTRRRKNGELETRFNTAHQFDMLFDPESQKFVMDYNKARLPMYPLMKALGVDDSTMERVMGKEIFLSNKNAKNTGNTLEKFFKTSTRRVASSKEEAEQYFLDRMAESKMHPDVNQRTLGKPIDHVNGEAILLAAKRLLEVQAGKPEDDRDSLTYKDLRCAGDFAYDKLKAAVPSLFKKANRKLNTTTDIREIIRGGVFSGTVSSIFRDNSASRNPSQINPVEIAASVMQTTIMGAGGIKSENAVMDEAKFINPTHLGFLDPINTPEGSRTGISLRMPIGVHKVGSEAMVRVFNNKTGKPDSINALTFLHSKVVMPDQVEWRNGKPTPVVDTKKVKMAVEGNNEVVTHPFSNADYTLYHPSHLFNLTSNLIPFLGSTSGNRAGMASRHIEQAVSLNNREVPLVQVSTGINKNGMNSFEEVMGSQIAHKSPVDGIVKSVGKHAIEVQAKDGVVHQVNLYHNYPLNDVRSVLHSTPLVKVGDKVKEKQVVADNNYSKDGILALGKNMRIGFMPYKGYNFEDGIVISESAAQKLSSVHMYKHELRKDLFTQVDKKKYLAAHPDKYTVDQVKHIQDNGLPVIGSIVKPGEPLLLATKPASFSNSDTKAIRRSLSGVHADKAIRWEGDTPCEVVNVVHNNYGTKVHARTIEPMQVGDKCCFDEQTEILTATGWKPVEQVMLQDEVCCLVDGKIVYQRPDVVYRYPTGGRMYRIASQQVDFFVTEKHEMFVKERGHTKFELMQAKAVAGRKVRYSKAGLWEGTDPDAIHFPALVVLAGQFGHGTRSIPEFSLPVKTYMILLGAFLSNGNYFEHVPSGSYGIDISKRTGPQFDELCAVAASSGIKFCVAPDGNASRLRIYSKQLLEHFKQFGHAADKYIPNEVFGYSKESLKVLLYWLMWGDGHSVDGKYKTYTSISKRLVDDIQRLCLHVGIAVNVQVRSKEGWQEICGVPAYCQTAYEARIVNTKLEPKVNHGHVKEQKIQEEYFVENYELPVYCVTVPGHVIYVRRNGKAAWSGNSGRYGNKGIVSSILPDKEMPHTKDGRPLEMLLNPAGVAARMNLGQVLEVAASKIAEKTGKPYIATSFRNTGNNTTDMIAELKKHGLSDTEEVTDPTTGQVLGKVMVGKQYMMKLVHQVDKKVHVSSGMTLAGDQHPDTYDLHLQPRHGQRVGSLGIYALLAHGSKAFLRESQTWKGEGPDTETTEAYRWPSQHREVWAAIQTGSALPTPKPTFVFHKFEQMLRGAGINMEKKGHQLVLTPLTDKHILELTGSRVLPNEGDRLRDKVDKRTGELQPKPGGLYDVRLTGGHGGTRWSRMDLAEPQPNPVFEAPICALTGLTEKQFLNVVHGTHALNHENKLVEIDKAGAGALTGGMAIKHLLEKIDVKRDLKAAEEKLEITKPKDIDPVLKKVKYLRALDKLGMKANEAYVIHYLPVIPPKLRPASLMADGNVKYADMSGLYSSFGQVNKQLKDKVLVSNLMPAEKAEMRGGLYDGLKALMGVGIPYETNKNKGLLHQIAGASPKRGFFQNAMVQKRQDLTMSSTIVPEPALGLDEVGLPREHAVDLFRPFLAKKLQEFGAAHTALDAQKLLLEKNNPLVHRALEHVLAERPVVLKRDPALHQYNMQGFNAKLVDGNAIKVHPLVCGGFNADFDGDAMRVFVPISRDAVDETHKMKPTANIFSEASGKVAFIPSMENALGIYKLSVAGKEVNKHFKEPGEILDEVRSGALHHTDVINLNGKKTTPGRVMLATAFPEQMQSHILHNIDEPLTASKVENVLETLGRDHQASFDKTVNVLKDMGAGASTGSVKLDLPNSAHYTMHDPKKNVYISIGVHTLSLKDFIADTASRDPVLKEAEKKIDQLKGLSAADKEKRTVAIYMQAAEEIKKKHMEAMRAPGKETNLHTMLKANVKPKWNQYKQMVIAPMLVEDTSGRTVPIPITRSYGEGLDSSSYWTQLYGARKGAVTKVQEVSKPGTISKLLEQVSLGTLVSSHDCGTKKGILLGVDDPSIHDRVLAQDYTAGKFHIPAGTVLSPTLTSQAKALDKNAKFLVRSSLKCEHPHGLCQQCTGLAADGDFHKIGTNIGVISSQALGERSVQLTLRMFHTGGVVGGTNKMVSSFDRVQQLTLLPKIVPNSATLAMHSGKIEQILPSATGVNVIIGGRSHFVGKDNQGKHLHTASDTWKGVSVGQHVEAGDHLSDPGRTIVNPHDLYEATKSMDKVQNHITSELFNAYKDENVKRQHVENIVKSMSNLTKIVHPGDAEDMLRGEYRPFSVIQARNAELAKAGGKLIEHTPVLKGINMLPLAIQEDWMAKMQHNNLRKTLQNAAATLGSSDIHGTHPIPGLVYGAEFGLTSAVSKQPGMGHLKNVPEHHY